MSSKLRVLLVEDEPALSLTVHDTLEYEGFEVRSAADGREALGVLKDFRPDVIVSDIVMPGMDGYQFLEAVRARPEWLDIPFIFLTGKDEKPAIRRGKALGVDDYLTKPFEPDDLLVSIRSKLRRRAELEAVSAQRARTLKKTILNTLTHEFRTPLTAITGYLNLVGDIEGEDRLTPDELRKFLGGIRRGNDRLTRLVEDFIFLIELETGEAQASFEARRRRLRHLGELIEETVNGFSERAAARKVKLKLDVTSMLPAVQGDPGLIADALGRLVDNAIKFSKKSGGTVVVGATADERWVRIVVQDRGVGIAAENLPLLFDTFSQIQRAKLEQQGSGIGLAIAQGIATLHGGRIGVESRPGVGSTFTLELPVASGA